tara:strand:+ start:1547 stop:2614 length:1068 start_codon:yes stop_codon:yes gene_type:complete
MIKVGTDFSGIGSPEAALKRLEIPHENIFACDINKYAKQSFLLLNNPSKFYDDITTRDYKEVPQLDLYVAGFPCQSFSLAGKRGGFDDVRGTLFFNVAEFIKVNQPKCFILENVRGLLSHEKGKTFQTITDVLHNGGGTLNGQMGFDSVDDGLGYHIYYKVLNTKNYGIPQNRERVFIIGFKDWKEFRFPKEIPLELRLKDLLEESVNEKYYLSDKMKNFVLTTNFREAKPIDVNKISPCIKVGGDVPCFEEDQVVVHNLHPRCGDPKKGGTGRLSRKDGITYCLDTGNNQAIEENKRIRRLTPLECWRLQGFTDEEFWKAQKVNSDTQLYKQAGNSITVNVMVEILRNIYHKSE